MARKKKDAIINEEAVQAEKPVLLTPEFVRQPQVEKVVKPRSSDLVCVALNRPYGISFRMPNGRKVEFKGNGQALIGKEKGILPIGAYGMTMVDKEDWEWIYSNYKSMPIFKNGLCFATTRKADAVDEAESRDDLRNGLEPVDTTKTASKEAEGE